MNRRVGWILGSHLVPRTAPMTLNPGDCLARPSPFACPQSKLLGHLHELPVHVLPLTQPQLRQKILLARLAELAPCNFRLQSLHEIPQREPAEKIGVRIEPLRVSQVSFLLSLDRPLARILHFERGGNNQNIGQALLAAGLDNHPSDSRINRQARELPANWRQPTVFIDRAQLKQRLVAVTDRLRSRRIEKWKLIDRAKIERQKLQNDGRQICPLNFRRGKPLAP